MWLLLSQHPGCLGLPTSFPTYHDFGTLAGGLGCFPLHDGRCTRRVSPVITFSGIRSLHRVVSRDDPLAETVLYPRR